MVEMQKEFEVKEFSLDQWRTLWLEKPSLNYLTPSWNPEDSSAEAKLTVKMTPYTENYPTLRPHKIKVGFFKENGSADVVEALLDPQEINEIPYNGSQGYKAILLNYEDHTFAKSNIDTTSRKFFTDNLHLIDDVLTRNLIWRSFFEMVKDVEITLPDFVEFLLKNIGKEKSDNIFERQFDLVLMAATQFVPLKFREDIFNQMFDLLLQLIK